MKITMNSFTFIALRFGKGASIKEIAKLMGRSQSDIRQLESKIIREIRPYIRNSKLVGGIKS